MNNRGAILLSIGYAAMLTALLGIILATTIILVLQGTSRDKAHLEGILKANNIIAQYKNTDLNSLVDQNIALDDLQDYQGEVKFYKDGNYIVIDVSLNYRYSTKTDEVRIKGYSYAGP